MANNSTNNQYEGLILVNKPLGFTSFDVTRVVGKALHTKKVGHSGTLDKQAEGLMLVCLGRATKLLTYLIGLDKRYIGEITFGSSTSTDDAEGEVLETYNGSFDENVITNALLSMRGPINQIPPQYSSIHVNGKRAYQLAVAKESFEIKPRQITVYDLQILEHCFNKFVVDIKCSSGTYIRSIARDAGLSTGYYAHISALQRVTVGNFELKDSFTLEQIKNSEFKIFTPTEIVRRLNYPVLDLLPDYCKYFRDGKTLSADKFQSEVLDGINCVVCDGEFVGIIEKQSDKIKYKFVY